MKIGDIVLYSGRRWKVVKHSSGVRAFSITSFDLETVEVPDDLDEVNAEEITVLFNPPESWPFVGFASSSLTAVTKLTCEGRTLAPMVDWVPSDFIRPGVIFLRPSLRLRTGTVLIAHHADGKLSRLAVTKKYGTIRQVQARSAKPKPEPPKTQLDRVLQGVLDDED